MAHRVDGTCLPRAKVARNALFGANPMELDLSQKYLMHCPPFKVPKPCWSKNSPGRKMGTKWVQIAPISMILGPECAVFCEDSESGLQMAPKGQKRPENPEKQT